MYVVQAVFLFLGKHTEELNHTSVGHDWECGVVGAIALKTKRVVWVLEAVAEIEGLSVVVPRVCHLVCFDTRNEQ
jgi:hypothetical protein